MLFLLIACTCLVYLSHHAPGLFAAFVGLGVLWLVYAIPVALVLGLSKFVNALPNWRWLHEPAEGGLLRLCGQYWLPLMLGGFVVFSLVAHTLLPR